MHNFCLSEAIIERFHNVEQELGLSEHIVSLDCDLIDAWELRDKKSLAPGKIESLAQSIKSNGQCQPIILVKTCTEFKPKSNSAALYVVISGYRRLLACKLLQRKVLGLVRNLTMEQAIAIALTECEKEQISDYSKGMFYHELLKQSKMSEEELCHKLNISLPVLQAYLSFASVPAELWAAVGDMQKVSAKTAAGILGIANKGKKYVEALKSIAQKIANGYGEKRLSKAVDALINKKMQGTSQDSAVKHKVKFDGKILVNLTEGRMKLDNTLVSHDNYNQLIAALEKEVIEFANNYLKKK